MVEKYQFLGVDAILASPRMRDLLQQVRKAAQSGASVLLMGESGSGKEIIARAIHHFSPRKLKPFVDLSCAALPEDLVESELFGHERGAFSGAYAAKPGLLELAHLAVAVAHQEVRVRHPGVEGVPWGGRCSPPRSGVRDPD